MVQQTCFSQFDNLRDLGKIGAKVMGMFRVAVNSTIEVAVALIVAKTEKLLDVEKYNQ